MKLPTWMRVVMYVTALLNLLGGLTFVPYMRPMRAMSGFPEVAHPLFLSTIGALLIIFGLAYLWSAVTGRADRQFVAVAAAGKLAFFVLLVRYWAAGLVPALGIASGSGDLVIGSLFLTWLLTTRKPS